MGDRHGNAKTGRRKGDRLPKINPTNLLEMGHTSD
jgi:hypothetical protein